jgi:hypothetical protein
MSDILSLCPPTYTPWALRPHSSYYSPLHLMLSPSSYGVTKRTRQRAKVVTKHLKVVVKYLKVVIKHLLVPPGEG